MLADSTARKLGIVAGSGDLPRMVIDTCRQEGRNFFVLAFQGETDPETIEDTPHAWTTLGAIGHAIRVMKDEGVEELVLAGRIGRPRLVDLRPDFGTFRLIAKIAASELKGDDAILSIIVEHLESQGFHVVGVESLVQDILAPEGLIGTIEPDAQAQADISRGLEVAQVIGSLDIGQAVVVQGGVVLGVEALEGTDALIDRVGKLKQNGPGGVLVKVCKPQQESRVDLPTIGVRTVEKIAQAGLRGIAVETGASLMLYRKEVARRANELGVFVLGISVGKKQ